jgi:preprotein translocase subunit SecG
LTTLIVTIHILVCVGLIILVLLQSGKEGMGVIFGGGSQSVFGSTGAGGLLVKLTAIFGTIFLITSLVYNVQTGAEKHGGGASVMTGVQIEEPAAPSGDAAKPASPASPKEEGKGPVKFEETAPAASAPSAGAEKTDGNAAAPTAQPGAEKPAGQ